MGQCNGYYLGNPLTSSPFPLINGGKDIANCKESQMIGGDI
jgi:hypothetical protein